MEEVLISIGTKDEAAQRAIRYANNSIVANWIIIALCVLVVAFDVFALVVIFSQNVNINSKVKDSIPSLFILFVLIFLITSFSLVLSHTYETRYDISANADKAVEYYIDMKVFDRYD